ncbi:MAG: hypothetical protein WBX11_06620, partial [Thiobacillaceae bacterium]
GSVSISLPDKRAALVCPWQITFGISVTFNLRQRFPCTTMFGNFYLEAIRLSGKWSKFLSASGMMLVAALSDI